MGLRLIKISRLRRRRRAVTCAPRDHHVESADDESLKSSLQNLHVQTVTRSAEKEVEV